MPVPFLLKGDALQGGGAGWDGNQEVRFKIPSVSGGDPERGGGCNESVRVLDVTSVPRKMKAEREGAPGLKTNISILQQLDSLFL